LKEIFTELKALKENTSGWSYNDDTGLYETTEDNWVSYFMVFLFFYL
jgi:hypothetical protein